MKISITALLCGVATVNAANNPAFTWGHSTYANPPVSCATDPCDAVPSCNLAQWAPNIKQFNEATNTTNDDFANIISYGGDVEFWAGVTNGCAKPASDDPAVCNVSVYFDDHDAKAAQYYGEVPGVKGVTVIVDGRMDGWQEIETYDNTDTCEYGDFYPDLRNISQTSITRLAEDTARLYCSSSAVDGIHVNMQPYTGDYVPAVNNFISAVANNLIDESSSYGCRDSAHPQGRAVSYSATAHDVFFNNGNVTPSPMNAKLGANGYYIFPAFNLDPKPLDGGLMYNTPDEFAQNLRNEIPYIRKVVDTVAKFTIAAPMSSTFNEYERFVPEAGQCGPSCVPAASNFTMAQYVDAFFEVITDEAVTNATDGLFCLSEAINSQFLGVTWWSWSFNIIYPSMKWFENEFYPASPSDDTLAAVRAGLPKLSDGSTCTKAQRLAMNLKPTRD